jgi:hypothetical protein
LVAEEPGAFMRGSGLLSQPLRNPGGCKTIFVSFTLSRLLLGAPSQEHWHEALLSSYLPSRASLFSATKSYMNFLSTVHEKAEFEEIFRHLYTLISCAMVPNRMTV